MDPAPNERPSLESLIESDDLGLEVLHPGGLETTRELADLCGIEKGMRVLDVASGTGESACFLAVARGCRMTGVDLSPSMVSRAARKASAERVDAAFARGDAHRLPFRSGAFDAVVSECTLCLLEKDRALAEMVRVARPGGCVGICDLAWREEAPQDLRDRLAAIEGERPETLGAWRTLFERAGLRDVRVVDRSAVLASWSRSIRRRLGVRGQLRLFARALRCWGIRGLRDVLESARIFESPSTGYALVAGLKP